MTRRMVKKVVKRMTTVATLMRVMATVTTMIMRTIQIMMENERGGGE